MNTGRRERSQAVTWLLCFLLSLGVLLGPATYSAGSGEHRHSDGNID